MIFIFLIIKKETKSTIVALVCSFLFTGTYGISGAWFDLAHVDMLSISLMLFSIYLLIYYQTSIIYCIAGILFALAFFSKQTVLPVGFALCIYSLFYKKRNLNFIFPLVLIIMISCGILLLNIVSDGWFSFYTFTIPRNHGIFSIFESSCYFLVNDIIKNFWPFLLIIILYFLDCIFFKRYKIIIFNILIFGSIFAISWFSRLHYGGFSNVLIPSYIAILLTAGICFGHTFQSCDSNSNLKSLSYIKIPKMILIILCIIQSVILFYNPLNFIPSKQDKEAGYYFIEKLKNLKGNVYISNHPYYFMTGKRSYSHEMVIFDVLRGGQKKINRKLLKNIDEDLLKNRFDYIVIDDNIPSWLSKGIAKNFVLKEEIFINDSVFRSRSGNPTRPEYIYELRSLKK